MNFVIVMTDSQTRDMLGAYGNPVFGTPNLDRLARQAVRFDRAYTTCPLCTPARSALLTGVHPASNGATCNNVPPYHTFPHLGTVLRSYGFRTVYTGKWHLEGGGYFGDGIAPPDFEQEYWYDGKCYAEEIGAAKFRQYREARTIADLSSAGFHRENVWAHRTADRAIRFLEEHAADERPFLLVASFDEPHAPFVAPLEFWERFDPDTVPVRRNFRAPLLNKPKLQQLARATDDSEESWTDYRNVLARFYGCNSFVDEEIGRLLDAVERLHRDETVVIYTSDHGDMTGSHGLRGKGPMMYQEVVNVPLLIRTPPNRNDDRRPGAGVSTVPVSHVDIVPTILELAGIDRPPLLQGESLAGELRRFQALPAAADMPLTNPLRFISFTRFAVNHDDWGNFYPIRCVVSDRYKLAINLFDSDELYDLAADPFELENRIDDPELATAREELHDAILLQMDRTRDPFRGHVWRTRSWRTAGSMFYHGGTRRPAPAGFPFQARPIEAEG